MLSPIGAKDDPCIFAPWRANETTCRAWNCRTHAAGNRHGSATVACGSSGTRAGPKKSQSGTTPGECSAASRTRHTLAADSSPGGPSRYQVARNLQALTRRHSRTPEINQKEETQEKKACSFSIWQSCGAEWRSSRQL